jgi:Alpha-L-arabinofuranosidase B, catalytic
MRWMLRFALAALGIFATTGGEAVNLMQARVSAVAPTCATSIVAGPHTFTLGANDGATSSPIDTTGTNLTVIEVFWSHGSNINPRIFDNKGNTYTFIGSPAIASGGLASQFYMCAGCAVGAGHTFGIDDGGGASVFGTIAVETFKNVAGAPLQTTPVGFVGAAGTASSLQSGYVSPDMNCTVVVTGVGTQPASGNATNPTAPAGYTLTDTTNNSPTFSIAVSMAYKIETTATAENPNWTTLDPHVNAATSAVFYSNNAPPAVTFVTGVCDVIGTGCAEAWDVTHAAKASYSGPLFQLWNGTTTLDIGQTGHVVDLTTWSSFCSGVASNCKVSKIYAQIQGSANDLIPMNFAVSGLDCTVGTAGVNGCAVPFTIEPATGLPVLKLRVGKEYTLASDAALTGVNGGSSAVSVVLNTKPLLDSTMCCGSFGLDHQHTAPNTAGTNFSIGINYGSSMYAGFCTTATSLCTTVDMEGATWQPFADYSTFFISNSMVLYASYNPTGTAATTYTNNHAVASTSGSGANFGLSEHLGGGGDGTQPANLDFRGGMITNTVLSSGDRAAIQSTTAAFFKALVFP